MNINGDDVVITGNDVIRAAKVIINATMVTKATMKSFIVSIRSGVGRFVPMVMAVERGDATWCLVFFKYQCLTVNSVT
jgi:hypothetical protein